MLQTDRLQMCNAASLRLNPVIQLENGLPILQNGRSILKNAVLLIRSVICETVMTDSRYKECMRKFVMDFLVIKKTHFNSVTPDRSCSKPHFNSVMPDRSCSKPHFNSVMPDSEFWRPLFVRGVAIRSKAGALRNSDPTLPPFGAAHPKW